MSLLKIERRYAKLILALGMPVVLAMLTQTGINLLDTAMVARLEAPTAIYGVAALNFSMPILWSIGGLLSSIGVGTQVITARRFGQKRYTSAGKVFLSSFFISIITSVILSIIAIIVVPYLYEFMTDNKMVQQIGTTYTRWRLVAIISMVTTASIKGFYDGIGKTYIHMIAAIIMNIFNAVANYCLIFGFWIFPRLEVTGAAIASMISSFLGMIIVIAWSFKPGYIDRFKFYKLANIDVGVIKKILQISIPAGITMAFAMLAFLVFLKIVGMLDEGRQLPINTGSAKLIIDFMSIVIMASIGFGQGTATLVGQSLGKKRIDQAKTYGIVAVKLMFIMMGVVGLFTILFPHLILRIFTDKEILISNSLSSMRLMGFSIIVLSVAIMFMQALYGAGDVKFVVVTQILLTISGLMPLAYLFGIVFDMGQLGLWIGFTFYLIIFCLIMAYRFVSEKWKHITI